MNRRLMTFAAVATVFIGGTALADSTTKTSPSAASSDTNATDKGATGNGGMAGSPAAAETPNVEGKTGSQSGAHPNDKMAPEQK
ncbi:hypothetical protein [Methylocella silvestris]|uniref:hypothetical protein n=1 Tax=Methylocella silvestris TaxID=199596 RepID=UPI0011AF488F|nr:hypothetical protein [Methylocella silvestris]